MIPRSDAPKCSRSRTVMFPCDTTAIWSWPLAVSVMNLPASSTPGTAKKGIDSCAASRGTRLAMCNKNQVCVSSIGATKIMEPLFPPGEPSSDVVGKKDGAPVRQLSSSSLLIICRSMIPCSKRSNRTFFMGLRGVAGQEFLELVSSLAFKHISEIASVEAFHVQRIEQVLHNLQPIAGDDSAVSSPRHIVPYQHVVAGQ